MIRRMTRIAAFGLAAASLVACDDGGESGGKTVEDPQTQMQSVQTARTSAQLGTIPVGADQAGAQGAISQVGSSIQGLVGQYQAAQAQAQAGLTAALQQGQAAQGTVNVTEGAISADVTYQTPQASVHYVLELTLADNDAGGKTYDGSFDMDFATSSAGYNIEYTYDARYNEMALDGTGCPVSGGISVAWDIKLSGANLPPQAAAAAGASNGSLSATFGPNCGDVAVTAN